MMSWGSIVWYDKNKQCNDLWFLRADVCAVSKHFIWKFILETRDQTLEELEGIEGKENGS